MKTIEQKTNSTETPSFKTPHEKTVAKKGAKAATEKKGTGKSTEKPVDKPAASKSKGKLGQILGHSVVSAIRAMGKNDWTFEEAQAVLDHLKIAAKPHTVRIALKRGRDNDKTRKIAPLSAKELNTLKNSSK